MGGISCPDDVAYHCSMYQYGIPDEPAARGTEEHLYALIRYIDDEDLNNCHVGTIYRRWYVDVDENAVYDEGEPSCIQHIELSGYEQDININYPPDLTFNCIEEEQDYGYPSVTAGSCDMIGISYVDSYYGDPNTSCYKIFRKYTICNYCDYDPDNPHWDGSGLWEHTQVIKFNDEDAPQITTCRDSLISLNDGCLTMVSLSNSAVDEGDCPSSELHWFVEVDVDIDGIVDYKYGYDQSGAFNIPAKTNGEEVSITLPGDYDRGYIEVTWKVSDACGNHDICIEKYELKDRKKPTPYCHQLLSISFDGSNGDSLIIPARLYDLGSFDNCDIAPLKVSFSQNVDDTIKVIKCGQQGFQFYRIYYTDYAGNQEFCSVYTLVFDNGSCGFTTRPEGTVKYLGAGDEPNMNAVIYNNEISDEVSVVGGSFIHNEMPLYEDLKSKIEVTEYREAINIQDMILVSNYVLGKDSLSELQLLAADMNNDGQVNFLDMKDMRSIMIHGAMLASPWILASEDDQSISPVSHLDYKDHFLSLDYQLFNRGDVKSLSPNLLTRDEKVALFKVEKEGNIYTFSNEEAIHTSGYHIYGHDIHHTGEVIQVKDEQHILQIGNEYIAANTNLFRIEASSYRDAIKKVQIDITDKDNALIPVKYIQANQKVLVKAYPTIFNESFQVSGEVEEVRLFDAQGRTVSYDSSHDHDQYVTITPDVQSGIILAHIKQVDGQVQVLKLVKL